MSHSINLKNRAKKLRTKGYSLKEISERLNIAKSTASIWLSSIKLSETARRRLANKQTLGQYRTVLMKREKRLNDREVNLKQSVKMLEKVIFSKETIKLLCALLWWCEGNKNATFVRFTNSDSTLVSNFIYLLRNGFELDESKFRVLVHLHKYHDDETQKKYWSEITGVSLAQFHKSYQKANTGVRSKEGYPGCIALTYYDVRVAKELEAIYNAFTLVNRGVG